MPAGGIALQFEDGRNAVTRMVSWKVESEFDPVTRNSVKILWLALEVGGELISVACFLGGEKRHPFQRWLRKTHGRARSAGAHS